MSEDETKPEPTETPEPSAPESTSTSETQGEAAESKATATVDDASAPAEAPSPAEETPAATAETPAEAPVATASGAAAPVSVEAAKPAQKAAPAALKDTKQLTPGQRLAAQKAEKAAKKSQQKMTRKEEAEAAKAASEILTTRPAGEPDEAEIRVAETRSYVASHSKQVVYAAVAIAAAFFAWFAFDQYSARQEASAGRLLVEATEAARAEIREEPAPGDTSRKLTFRSLAARDREALRRFRKVVSEAPSSDAAVRARLGIASILVAQDKLTEAKRELEAAAGLRGDDPGLGAQAVEGLGVIALEQRQWSQAKQRFEELRALDGNRYQHVANYLAARTLYAQGRPNEAKPKLRALLDALEEADAPRLPYVQTQAELLLQQIDPSTARPRPAGLGGGGLDLSSLEGGNIPPELLEQLQRQLQQQGGAPQ